MVAGHWSLGMGPKDKDITVDIDSTICEVYGKKKEGAGYGYTKVLGLHPLIATLAATGEIIHIRNRNGSAHTGKGASHFISQVIHRIRNATDETDQITQQITQQITLRADS